MQHKPLDKLTASGPISVTVSVAESSTNSLQTVRELNINTFYWITAGCISALVVVAIVGVSVACTCRRYKRREKIKVDRVNGNSEHFDHRYPSAKISR